jgi:hypothetical protein
LDTAFLNRTLRASLFLTALSFLMLSYYVGTGWALGFTLGALWSAANLLLLRELIVRWLTPGDRPWAPLLLLILAKFPLLYFVGYWILRQSHYPVTAPLLGFGLPLAVMVLKAAGRLWLGIHGPDAGRAPHTVFGRR